MKNGPATARNLWNDAGVLWHLVVARVHGTTHAERLESFYGGQAESYDAFRSSLLHGRQELIDAIPWPTGGVWMDMGAGTGENASRLGERIFDLSQAYLVDLSPSLLKIADRRIEEAGWNHVTAVCGDATAITPPEASADVVTFSYSLTMIPDWFRAIEHARALLKPGGILAVVDFYVARKYPDADCKRHGWSTRSFWPLWFGCDNVFLNPDHVPFLENRFERIVLKERKGKVPYMPFVRAPYYWFVGRKPLDEPGV